MKLDIKCALGEQVLIQSFDWITDNYLFQIFDENSRTAAAVLSADQIAQIARRVGQDLHEQSGNTRCASCGIYLPGYTLCADCAPHFTRCAACGRLTHRTNMVLINDEYHCAPCADAAAHV